MKTTKFAGLLAIGLLTGTALVTSCKKSDDSTPSLPPIGGYNSSNDVASTNLVAYWPFDGNSTETKQSLSGTATNITYTTGKKGQALQGSSTGYVLYNNIGTALPSLSSYTVSFWMNASQATADASGNGGAKGIFDLVNSKDTWGNLHFNQESSKGDTLYLKVEFLNNAAPSWKNQFLDTKVPGVIGKMSHIAATYDGNSSIFRLYVNGNEVGINSGGNPGNSKGPTLHGNDPTGGGGPLGPLQFANATAAVFGTWQFQTTPSLTSGSGAQTWAGNYAGILDEFRIYNKALSTADVGALYQLESAGR